MFGLSAPEVAAILMENWKFPQAMCDAVRHHLEPMRTPGVPIEADWLNLAGWVATKIGKGLPGESGCFQLSPAKLERAGVSEEVLQKCAEATQAALTQIRVSLR